MTDGIIKLDSEYAKEFGFTSDKFHGYLWKNGDYVWISFIESINEGKGNLSKLFNAILEKGYNIIVPTPLGKMVSILIKKGFKFTILPNGVECGVMMSNKEVTNGKR